MKFFSASIALITVLLSLPALAGTSGVLNGFARDERGRPIVGVEVLAISVSRLARTRTDAHGFFSFIDLPPDVYTVAAQKQNLTPVSYSGTRINSDQTTFLTFTLDRLICGGHTSNAPESADQRADDFTSLDLRALSDYPPLQPTPMIAMPGPIPWFYSCL
jgi:hypothetical protein